MESRPEYDVIIVGGGPAGSTAARLLGKAGYSVALLERQAYPRDKICGGCLSQKTIRFLDRAFSLPVDALRQEGLLDFTGTGYALYIGNRRILAGGLDEPVYFTSRKRYDAYLAKAAGEDGAEIHTGAEVGAVDHAHRTVTTSDGDRYSARVIIGADGVHSRVRRTLPEGVVDRERWQSNLGWTLELAIPRREVEALADEDGAIRLDADLATPHLVFAACRWGYGWVFPNREAIIVGIGGLLSANGNSLRDRFKAFLKDIGFSALIDRRPAGYPLPLGNYVLIPAHAGTVLIGDAAGFTGPLLGEGIFYAHRTAEFAAYAVDRHLMAGSSLAGTYAALLRRHLIPELRAETALRNYLYRCLDARMHTPLVAFMRASKTQVIDTVQGSRSFRGFLHDDDLHPAVWPIARS